jgi:hypothetical protein
MTDLFEHIHTLPIEVQQVLEKYSDDYMTYADCNDLIDKLNVLGYTCEYGLDSVPYNLTKIKQ